MMYLLLVFVSVFFTVRAQNAGDCMCVTDDPLNVRDGPCGNAIGSAYIGHCFTHKGGNQWCNLGGTDYHFHQFDFNGVDGWAAMTFMEVSDPSRCSGVGQRYECSITNQGRRVHETTAPTVFDCRDNSCANTCQGGQCVAYVTCSCTIEGGTAHAPGTSCWRPGTKVANPDGTCNRNIPANTAIATFTGSSYYAGHAAVFTGCLTDYSLQAYDQWCCSSIGYTTYASSHSYWNDYHVITRAESCTDRPTWDCRWEDAEGSCCPVSVPGCRAATNWLDVAINNPHHVNDIN